MSFSQVSLVLFVGLVTAAVAFPNGNLPLLSVPQSLMNNLPTVGKTFGNAAAQAPATLLQAPATLLKGVANAATATGRVADNLANTASDTATQITNDPANTANYASSGLLAGVVQIIADPIRLMVHEFRVRLQEAIVVLVRNLVSQIPQPMLESLRSVIEGLQGLLMNVPVVGTRLNEHIDTMKNSGMMNLDENSYPQNNNNQS